MALPCAGRVRIGEALKLWCCGVAFPDGRGGPPAVALLRGAHQAEFGECHVFIVDPCMVVLLQRGKRLQKQARAGIVLGRRSAR